MWTAFLLAWAITGSSIAPAAPQDVPPAVSSTAVSQVLSPGGWQAPLGSGHPDSWRRGVVLSSYVVLYGSAIEVGSRLGLERRFKMVRLESAYAYDLVAHVYNVQQLGLLMGDLHEWAGLPRGWGVWAGAFGALTAMEIVNGFMPRVRFDPLDPVANAAGAWLATGGHDLARDHPQLRRFSLEFGYKSWGRVFGPRRSSGTLGNVWHDYPNGRFGVGTAVGPLESPWVRVFVSYEITSMDVARMHNRVGLGVELQAEHWLGPWLRRLPGGKPLVAAYEWLNGRLLMPGLYLQILHFDAGPFSRRQPFDE
jgi:hypothetical protein